MPKTYYKATRPDGTDFRTGTVDYAAALKSGKPVARKPVTDFGFECCSDTVYHAADTPSETLIGGSWPCRLFEVTGKPVAEEGHKYGFRSLRVRREIPAWQALGPNGEKVTALIGRAATLTADEAVRLDAAWNAAWYITANAAWYITANAARDAARYAARDAAWNAARYAAWNAARYAAANAALSAAYALTVEDLVGTGNFTTEHFDLLYGPWRTVIGDPT
ncbi:hypothetical protein [Streptomyces sp. NPDC055085]